MKFHNLLSFLTCCFNPIFIWSLLPPRFSNIWRCLKWPNKLSLIHRLIDYDFINIQIHLLNPCYLFKLIPLLFTLTTIAVTLTSYSETDLLLGCSSQYPTRFINLLILFNIFSFFSYLLSILLLRLLSSFHLNLHISHLLSHRDFPHLI